MIAIQFLSVHLFQVGPLVSVMISFDLSPVHCIVSITQTFNVIALSCVKSVWPNQLLRHCSNTDQYFQFVKQ